MDINSLNSQNPNVAARNAVTSTNEAEASNRLNQATIASSREDEKPDGVAHDTATLSTEGYRLSSASVVRGVSNETQISDRQKAQELVSNFVTAAQNNPAQVQKVVGSTSPIRVAGALA